MANPWERKLSTSTGAFYWSNSASGETSWELDSEMLDATTNSTELEAKRGGDTMILDLSPFSLSSLHA